MKRDEYVTAGEIGDYIFCKRGWWLKCNNMLPDSSPRMDAGIQSHESVAKQLQHNKQNTKIALSLIGFGLVLVILIILMVVFKIA
ncbi:MAG TPA: OadG family protein [Candidatus Saccharimonadales bacterium]|nr:OadG family protein [Candidatus Saccharimonadales bacterium]